jgi:phosphatidylglycerophosphate synthase
MGTLTAKGAFPLALTGLIVGRDVALLGGAFVYRYFTKPPETPFFATTGEGVIEVQPSALSRINTVLQMSLIGFALTVRTPCFVFIFGVMWGRGLPFNFRVAHRKTTKRGVLYSLFGCITVATQKSENDENKRPRTA